MTDRSPFEQRAIGLLRDLIGATRIADSEPDEQELRFAEHWVNRWERHGLEEAAGGCAAVLELARRGREARGE